MHLLVIPKHSIVLSTAPTVFTHSNEKGHAFHFISAENISWLSSLAFIPIADHYSTFHFLQDVKQSDSIFTATPNLVT
jgi:hypothetical protein